MTAQPAASLQLLVDLGNPGDKYAGTRHNVGFMALERLASRHGVAFKVQAKLHGLLAEVGHGPSRLRLLMPQTYMNDSGRSIRAALDWYGIEPVQMLVLVDDMDLPLGRLRLRASGMDQLDDVRCQCDDASRRRIGRRVPRRPGREQRTGQPSRAPPASYMRQDRLTNTFEPMVS